MNFGNYLKQLRGSDTQAVAARKSGMSQQLWSKLERGLVEPEVSAKLPGIADAYGVSLDDLRAASGVVVRQSLQPNFRLAPDEAFIPRINVQGSMGLGAGLPEHLEIVSRLAVIVSELKKMASFSAAENLHFISAYGDSMSPTFADGDVLLIDTGVDSIRLDAVYAMELRGDLYIKRIQRRPDGSYMMISDNKAYEPYLINGDDLADFRVRGRVVLAWAGRRL